MRCLIVTLAIVMVQCAVVSGQSTTSAGVSDRNARRAGQYCGPCCVHYVLKMFGQKYDLEELIREVQPPELKEGATLDSLSMALSQRGLHTLPAMIRSAADVELTSPYPIILHLNAQGTRDAHYVVWLPSASRNTTTIWDPAIGAVTETTWGEYGAQVSGAMLLTSPAPLTSPDFAIRARADRKMVWLSAGFAVTALLLVAFCFASRGSALPTNVR